MNVVSVHFVGEIRLAEIRHVVEHNVGGDFHVLRPHVFHYTVGRVKFAYGVGHKHDEVANERNVANGVSLNDVFQHNGVEHPRKVFAHHAFIVNAYVFQCRKSTKIEVFPKCFVAIC